MSDREPTVINNSGSAGWAVAVIILLAVIVGGYFLFGDNLASGKNVEVNVKLPTVATPSK